MARPNVLYILHTVMVQLARFYYIYGYSLMVRLRVWAAATVIAQAVSATLALKVPLNSSFA